GAEHRHLEVVVAGQRLHSLDVTGEVSHGDGRLVAMPEAHAGWVRRLVDNTPLDTVVSVFPQLRRNLVRGQRRRGHRKYRELHCSPPSGWTLQTTARGSHRPIPYPAG